MNKNFKGAINLLLIMISAILIFAPNVFATSTALSVTKKLINTKTITASDAISLNAVKLQENTAGGFLTSGKYFTVKVPLEVKLCATGYSSYGTPNTGEALTQTTTMLGSKAAPHNLYLKSTGSNIHNVFLYHSASGLSGSSVSIMTVYSHTSSSSTSIVWGDSAGSEHPAVAAWGTFGTYKSSSATAGVKVGQIYYDATDGVILTLAARGRDSGSYLEEIWLQGLKVIPATANTTGTVSVTTADGDADGADGVGVSTHTIGVATLVAQAASISGSATGSTPPTIPAGKVAGQASGRLKIDLVGLAHSDNNVITVTLDNGAKFHSGAADATTSKRLSSGTMAVTVADTGWSFWEDSQTTYASLAVNTSGALVITLGTQDLANEASIIIPASTTGQIIDTAGVTASGDITATVSATGTDLGGITGSAVVATAQLTGAGVTFVDDTTAGLTSIYKGRKNQTIGSAEKIRITETAPTSLFAGGITTFALGSGAKFNSGSSFTGADYTASSSSYTDSALAFPTSTSVGTTANSSVNVTVSAASVTSLGIWDFTAMYFDLTSATTGPLQITVSGSAGASGVVTVATIVNATTTTIASPIMVIPGQTVSIPDIVITESEVGALVASKIGLKFPTGFTLSASSATVTATKGGTSTSIGSLSVGTSDESYAHFDVSTQSSTGTGVYVITISGLTATTTTGISQGTANVIVGGAADATWASTSATFGSNAGAKPTKQTVKFGDVVSPTVPFISTAAPVGTVITQTFIPAGNDIGKVGDLYVFTLTPAQYYSGGAWSATATPYAAAGTLGSTPVVYDISAVAASTKIYVGYGTGVTGTESTMNTNGTFVLAYTTAAAPAIVPVVIPATAGAAVTATINTTDTYTLNLATTNAAGATPTAEYVVYQVIVSGTPSGWWFMTPTGSVQYVPGLDPTTVTYDTAAAGSISLGDFLLGTYLPTAGDELILVYAYATGTVDFTDPTTFELENVVTMTVQ